MDNKPVQLVWATHGGDTLVAYMARISNPKNQGNTETGPKLIRSLIRMKHWSPFEMVNMCVEINTTRDIGRQIIRHKTMYFSDASPELLLQEFSQRYQKPTELEKPVLREARLQDSKNRQSSLETDDMGLHDWFRDAQLEVIDLTDRLYNEAIEKGIAKEQARAILPEGLTPTRLYVNGTVRSWIHFLQDRLSDGAQKEVREIAKGIKEHFMVNFPTVYTAVFVPEEG